MTNCLIVIKFLYRNAGILANTLIDLGFNKREFFIRNRSGVVKVEAQSFRRHQRSGLTHMVAQFRAQYRVQDVRRRMVEHGFLTILAVNEQLHFIIDLNAAFFYSAAMRRELRRRMLRVDNFDNIAARRFYYAAVADLAAGFAIEWRLGGE